MGVMRCGCVDVRAGVDNVRAHEKLCVPTDVRGEVIVKHARTHGAGAGLVEGLSLLVGQQVLGLQGRDGGSTLKRGVVGWAYMGGRVIKKKIIPPTICRLRCTDKRRGGREPACSRVQHTLRDVLQLRRAHFRPPRCQSLGACAPTGTVRRTLPTEAFTAHAADANKLAPCKER